MVNVKVLKLGLKVSPDTSLVSVPWCGSQPTLRVWLACNSSTNVWNVLCFEEWMSKGLTMAGLCLVLHWSSQNGVGRKWFQWTCLLSAKMVVDIGNIILSALMWWGKSSPNKYTRVYCPKCPAFQLCGVAFIPLSSSFYFCEMEVLTLTYLSYESIGFHVLCMVKSFMR